MTWYFALMLSLLFQILAGQDGDKPILLIMDHLGSTICAIYAAVLYWRTT